MDVSIHTGLGISIYVLKFWKISMVKDPWDFKSVFYSHSTCPASQCHLLLPCRLSKVAPVTCSAYSKSSLLSELRSINAVSPIQNSSASRIPNGLASPGTLGTHCACQNVIANSSYPYCFWVLHTDVFKVLIVAYICHNVHQIAFLKIKNLNKNHSLKKK